MILILCQCFNAINKDANPIVYSCYCKNNSFSPLQDIQNELKCAVCLSIMDQPTVIPDCMHRFCFDCIDKSLRLGKKECPQCRTKCVSKRSFRPDTRIAQLIQHLYPDLAVANAQLVIELT